MVFPSARADCVVLESRLLLAFPQGGKSPFPNLFENGASREAFWLFFAIFLPPLKQCGYLLRSKEDANAPPEHTRDFP
jgi:hypothetical protein